MPVGNSDRGVGLGAGEIMFFSDYNYQYIDWSHGQLPGQAGIDEPFEHMGTIKSDIVNLGLTIGLNDYWNISLSHILGERCMEWEGEEDESGSMSSHHRTECSSSDFYTDEGVLQAHGGLSGDTKLSLKFLLFNQGKGPGDRMYLGGGLIIPSKNTLHVSPFEVVEDPEAAEVFHHLEHRHFYMSDGVYKSFLETQFFRKRMNMPVFWGGTLYFETPFEKNKYGFSSSKVYEMSLIALSGPLKGVKSNTFKISSIGLNFSVRHQTEAKWNGEPSPNSKATTYIPGISILFMSKVGTFGINIQRPYTDTPPTSESEDIDGKAKMMQISLSYRKVFDKIIDAFYW